MSVKKYLMFDRKWIINSNGFKGSGLAPVGDFNFKVYKPTKSEAPFLIADKPWEDMSVGWGTLLYDQGKYKLWYEAYDKSYKGDLDGRLCYAESLDGVTWDKPVLGLVEYKGSKENNIVFDGNMAGGLGFHGHCVFIDPTSRPEARYRMIFHSQTKKRNNPNLTAAYCMSFAYSEDGLHWNWGFPEGWIWLKQPVLSFGSDTQSVVMWDPKLRSYTGYFRNWEDGYGRTIARSTTNDLTQWPYPETILQIDDDEPFGKDFYNSAASLYESGGDSGYFMFISMFRHDTDTLDIRLASSRDGKLFKRLDREEYVNNGDTFDGGAMYMCPGIFTIGNECVMAYHARHYKHLEAKPEIINYAGCYNFLKFPVDRLQGLNTDSSFEFSLKEFRYEGGSVDIYLNAEARNTGEIRGALLPVKGAETIDGFSFEDCTPVYGDKSDLKISWKGSSISDTYKGKMLELRLLLKNAILYSVTIEQK